MPDQRVPTEASPAAASLTAAPLPRHNLAATRLSREGLRDLFEREREERRAFRRAPETVYFTTDAAPSSRNCFSDD